MRNFKIRNHQTFGRVHQLFKHHAENFFPGVKNIPDLKRAVLQANLIFVSDKPVVTTTQRMRILARLKSKLDASPRTAKPKKQFAW